MGVANDDREQRRAHIKMSVAVLTYKPSAGCRILFRCINRTSNVVESEANESVHVGV